LAADSAVVKLTKPNPRDFGNYCSSFSFSGSYYFASSRSLVEVSFGFSLLFTGSLMILMLLTSPN